MTFQFYIGLLAGTIPGAIIYAGIDWLDKKIGDWKKTRKHEKHMKELNEPMERMAASLAELSQRTEGKTLMGQLQEKYREQIKNEPDREIFEEDIRLMTKKEKQTPPIPSPTETLTIPVKRRKNGRFAAHKKK